MDKQANSRILKKESEEKKSRSWPHLLFVGRHGGERPALLMIHLCPNPLILYLIFILICCAAWSERSLLIFQMEINKYSKKPIIIKKPRDKADVYKTYGNNKKIKNYLNKRFKFTDYKKGIEKTCIWYLKNYQFL